ncbi:multiple sugar transport system substrate-binding protein [Natronincola peptidivorans]|uniref:Multiple sugar transport system substrate-binding protein n=1 Tax=Natronincola peptidivorans TaxID=426128 RepID=A0A1I0B0N1_9FIRM|nr:extracellular solute-binding protein [Natronincola peptidivorans]SET00363.1 multiple sugar transport system substrate-binding protein [Natronincola peptidivorans]
MKKLNIFFIVLLLIILSFLLGCQKTKVLNPKEPITLTIWHNYGGQMKTTMDIMIDEFNDTIGAEKGVILSVTSISGSATLHEKLIMAANQDPGAPELPDITTAYPKTAITLAEKNLLVDIGEFFTEKELTAYVPRFLEEGRLKGDRLFVFPCAKSTEVLYVNKTIFDRFSNDTDISFEDLKSFEGIVKAADSYYEWSEGKMFFMPDSLFNLAQIGYQQLGEDLFKGTQLNLSSPAFSKIWETYYEPAVKGHFAIFDGYATDLAKTGDIICALGSTAGVIFYPPTITYENNLTEPVEYSILPYPVYKDGEKIAIQRGSGMCVIKSTEEKAYAASIFLKWFTDPKQNLRFVSKTGYLPVTKEAFGDMMTSEIESISDDNIKALLITAIQMHDEYDFYIPPYFDDFDRLQREYEERLLDITLESRKEYLELITHLHATEAYGKIKERQKIFLENW